LALAGDAQGNPVRIAFPGYATSSAGFAAGRFFNSKPILKIRTLLLASGAYGLAEVAMRLVQAATMFWVVAVCSKQTFGEIGLLISVQQMVTLLALGGIVDALSGRISERRSRGSISGLLVSTTRAFWLGSLIAILLYTVAYWLSPNGYFGATPALAHVCVVISGILFARITLASSIERLQEKHRSAIASKAIPTTTGFVMAAFAVVIEPPQFTYFLGLLAGAALGLLVLLLASRRESVEVHDLNLKEVSGLYVESFPFLVAALMAWASGIGMNLFVGAFISATEVAEFTLVLSIISAVSMIPYAVNQVWYPRFLSVAQGLPRDQLDQANSAANRLTLFLLSLAASTIIAFFVDVVSFIGGNISQYASIHGYLLVSLLSFVSLSLHYRSTNYYLLYRMGRTLMNLVTIASIVSIAIWAVLILMMGVWGIYVGFLLANFLRSAVEYGDARRRWKVSMDWVAMVWASALITGSYALAVTVSSFGVRIAIFTGVVALLCVIFYLGNRTSTFKVDLHP